jgi:hypothetical protein
VFATYWRGANYILSRLIKIFPILAFLLLSYLVSSPLLSCGVQFRVLKQAVQQDSESVCVFREVEQGLSDEQMDLGNVDPTLQRVFYWGPVSSLSISWLAPKLPTFAGLFPYEFTDIASSL